MQGKVKFFDERKRFGFVIGEDGKEYFVHKSSIKDDVILNKNDEVTFDLVRGDKGLKAENVTLIKKAETKKLL